MKNRKIFIIDTSVLLYDKCSIHSFPGNDYVCSPSKNIRRFQQQLRNLGIVVTTRKTRGADIHAACGQLTGKVSDKILFRLGKKIGIAESNG